MAPEMLQLRMTGSSKELMGVGRQASGIRHQASGARVRSSWPISCVGEFRDLSVYQRSVELGDALHFCVAAWDAFDRWSVGIQMVREVDSIGANIAESSGRTRGDQRRFLMPDARCLRPASPHASSKAAQLSWTPPSPTPCKPQAAFHADR